MKSSSSFQQKAHLLAPETIAAMEQLGLVLKSIYLRMKKDGYELVDGQLKYKGNDKNQV